MMQKKKSNRWAQTKYLLAVPVTALGVMLFATPAASAISAEISGCKVSDLFSADQILASENAPSSAELLLREGNEEFVTVEEVPEFPGGTQALMQFIAETLRYPAECADSKIEGHVILGFVVEKDGTIADIEEMRSPDERLTAEAIRVVSLMPKWNPGKQRGQEVRVKYVLPISFRLNNDNDGVKVIGAGEMGDNVIENVIAAHPQIHTHIKEPGVLVVGNKVLPFDQIDTIKPEDIESMEVLKDDASISRYIDQYPAAKNGVIIITLKK